MFKLINAIVKGIRNDPVKKCPVYLQEGCAHVDGPLCDFPNCSMVLSYRKPK